MKKFISLSVICTLLLSLLSLNSFASEQPKNDTQVIFEATKITDIDKLRVRALNGITDSDSGFVVKENMKDKVKTTTQKIKTKKDPNNNLVNTYVETAFIQVDDPSQSGVESLIGEAFGGGVDATRDYDPSISVEICMEVSYDRYTWNNIDYYKMTYARTWITKHSDRTVTVVDANLVFQQFGYTLTTHTYPPTLKGLKYFNQKQTFTYPADYTSYHYNFPVQYSDLYCGTVDSNFVAMYCGYNFKRGTSSAWGFDLPVWQRGTAPSYSPSSR